MGTIGIWGIVILVLVALLLFGPKRLPQIGRSLGRGLREFKETVTDQTKELKEATIETPRQFKEGLNPFKASDRPADDTRAAEDERSEPVALPPASAPAEPAAAASESPREQSS